MLDLFDWIDLDSGCGVLCIYSILALIALVVVILGIMTFDASAVAGTLRIASGLLILGADIMMIRMNSRSDAPSVRSVFWQTLLVIGVLGIAVITLVATAGLS